MRRRHFFGSQAFTFPSHLWEPVSTSPENAIERRYLIGCEGIHMTKFLFVIPLVLIASAAQAQQGHDACARDVSRFCRAQMQEGDQIVLACLKTNRARISKACQALLASHGQ